MIPGVTLICLDCTDEEKELVKQTEYENLDIKYISWKSDGLHGVFQIILDTQNPYICFEETGKRSAYDKVKKMVDFLEQTEIAGCVICQQEYVLSDETHIGWMSQVYMRELERNGSVLNGKGMLEISLNTEANLYGSLTCCMLRKERFINKDFLLNYMMCDREEERMLMMFECLYGMNVGRIGESLVKVIEKDIDIEASRQDIKLFNALREKILSGVYKRKGYVDSRLPSCYINDSIKKRLKSGEVKKEITLFHMGKAEYFVMEPLAKEAEKRGYQVTFSEDIGKEAEIGIYCSHVGCLQRGKWHAKFSVIMLHDMTQGELDWPDLWNEEPWNNFDIGILPGKTWAERWQSCSGFRYAHPKLGVYEAGYPKGDYVYDEEYRLRAEKLKQSLNLKYDKTIMYAPSWENDGKEDEFVKALCDLPVNLLIKQGQFMSYPEIFNNIVQMRKMHEGKYDNVYYIEPVCNIMDAYPFCDVVVSDESGALTEALLFNKPSVAVMDWLIPDVYPSRYSVVPVDYVHKCNKAELRETVEKVLAEEKYECVEKSKQVFSHMGCASSNILDLIDFYIGQSENEACLATEIKPKYRLHGLWD